MAILKLPVFWSSRKLTSLRGTGASALPPLTIFHSLCALQRWLHCTQTGHRLQQSRRCCIPAQHRRAAMTHFPACCAAPLRINTFPLRAAAAVWQSQLPRRLSSRAQGLGRVTVCPTLALFLSAAVAERDEQAEGGGGGAAAARAAGDGVMLAAAAIRRLLRLRLRCTRRPPAS